jgi:hypothetical protein
MMTIDRKRIRWKLGILAGLGVVLVTMIPQLTLWFERRAETHGAYAITDPDELVYSAYLNSIINEKPRRNDPFLPRLNETAVTHETYFSLQFVPPFAIAWVSQLLGLEAATAFILLTPLFAFASSLAVFWLLCVVTGDEKASAIGVLLVLLCGVLAAANLLTEENYYAVFSFLRRYIPALPFPLFFVFCVCVWRAFGRSGIASLLWAIAGGVIFVILIYSYFYLWTTAGALLFIVTVLWLMFHKEARWNVLKVAAIIGGAGVIALVPWFRLLSQRSHTIDHDQALLLTRAPDLFRFTEILGALILAAVAYGVRKKRLELRSPAVLFIAGCAITPFIVLNQQVITGRSLQPFHYEQFILSYLVLVAAVILDTLWWKQLTRRAVLCIALAFVIGISLAAKASKVHSSQNHTVDAAIPLLTTLEEDVKSAPSKGYLLFDRTLLAASAPSYTSSLHLLWSPYTYTYGSVSPQEDNERLFQYFYYLGVDERKLLTLLEGRLYRAALFGLHRVNKTLTQKFVPVTRAEIQDQIDHYSRYKESFSQTQAELWPLSHVVVAADGQYDLSNLDRWYERDSGQRFGNAIVYRVRLRLIK